MNKNIGIYKILNTKNNKVYIGSSKNLKHRKEQHFSMLKNNNHHSIYLQRAYNKTKDAENVFKFEIIEYCNREDLLNRENYYLNRFCKSEDYLNNINKDFLKISYNILPVAKKGFTKRHRKESIEKFVKNNPNRKEVLCYLPNGELYKEFFSVNEAGRETKISANSIRLLCKNKTYISRSFIFGYKNDEEFLEFIKNNKKPIALIPWNKGKKYTKEEINKLSWCTKIKSIDLLSKEVKIFSTQKEACLFYNLQPCTVNRCLKNKRPYKKKLLFEYYDIVQS